MYILYANSTEPDQTPLFAASDLGLHFLNMSNKKDAMLPCEVNLSCTSTTAESRAKIWYL